MLSRGVSGIVIIDDDPVHTYLREIGRVPLLTAEQEVWLSTQLAAAAVLENLTNISMETGSHAPRHDALINNFESLNNVHTIPYSPFASW